MTRQQFLNRLRNGLAGLPPTAIDEIVADYEGHFTEGASAGRSESEIAAALGDPERHAREMKAEAGIKRWQTERNPAAAAGAVFGILGLGALDLIVVIPFLTSIGGVLLALYCTAAACFGVGAAGMVAGPFWVVGAPPSALIVGGLGLMSAGVFVASGTSLAFIGIINALVWYGRLHMRVFRPALETQGGA
ncbi:MAG TPA: DUF1700 domain-containing protein [Caulobacteraceae bacterium]|jgi:uncharacterized membrane protein